MLQPDYIQETVKTALREDLGGLSVTGDITAGLIEADKQGTARLFAQERGVLCGQAWFDASFTVLDKDVQLSWHSQDGERITKGQMLCEIYGTARSILAAERTALNFLQVLSGTATQSAHLAALQTDTTLIFDTRKTIPGLRAAQKYAVAVGGCHNHRISAYDAFLIKENHLKCGSMERLVTSASEQAPDKPIIVEVENLSELKQALRLSVQVILLDNFAREEILQAIKMASSKKGHIALEISGGVMAGEIKELVPLGVERISLGSLTKHCKAIDFSLRFE